MQRTAPRSLGIARQGKSVKLVKVGAVAGETVTIDDVRMYKGGVECTNCSFSEGDSGTVEVDVSNQTDQDHTIQVYLYLSGTVFTFNEQTVGAGTTETITTSTDWNDMKADAGTGDFDLGVELWSGDTSWDSQHPTDIDVTLQEAGEITMNTPGITDHSLAPGETAQFQAGFNNTTDSQQSVTVSFQLGNLEFAQTQETISTGEDIVAVSRTWQELRDIPLNPGEYTFTAEVTESSTGFTGSKTDPTPLTIKAQETGEVTATGVTASPTTLNSGETLSLGLEIENTTDSEQTVNVHWELDTVEIASAQATLSPGETRTVSGSASHAHIIGLGLDPAAYTLSGVLESGATWPEQVQIYGPDITVRPQEQAGEQTITLESAGATDMTLSSGESTTLQASLASTLDASKTPTVAFTLDGTQVGTAQQQVPAGETVTVTHTVSYSDLVTQQGFNPALYTLGATLQGGDEWGQQTVTAPGDFTITAEEGGGGGGGPPGIQLPEGQGMLVVIAGIAVLLIVLLMSG